MLCKKINMKVLVKIIFLVVVITSGWSQQTFVPDDNFEHFLETHDANMNVVPVGDPNSLGNGIDNDNLVTTAKIAQLTTLLIAGENMTDLTGIEDFSALELLNCNNNQITSLNIGNNTSLKILRANTNLLTNLDISQNFNLEVVDVSYNQITDLDVSQNRQLLSLSIAGNSFNNIDVSSLSNLEVLNGSDNNISQIDVSGNPALKVLFVNNNLLASLDISQNANLEELECAGNQLTSIDVSNNPGLISMVCNNNMLSVLDVSLNPDLEALNCAGNQITALDLSHNPDLIVLFANNNQLTSLNIQHGNTSGFMSYFTTIDNPDLMCILVDDTAWSMANWPIVTDPWTNLVETDTECLALEVDKPLDESLDIYPNPLDNRLYLQLASEGTLTVYAVDGQILVKQPLRPGKNTVDVSQVPPGLLLVEISSLYGTSIKKCIKR